MTDQDFCPYVGLRPFTAAERAYFFGRERDRRVIAANLVASPLTVLYGPSAVGKSSVLQAGVVPQLAVEPRTAVVYFATWQDAGYIAQLRAECRRAFAATHGAAIDVDDSLPLDDWLAHAASQVRGTLFIVLDQFEEYLLYHAETDAASFDAELARIVNRRDVPANVLIGIREDGLAKLDRFKKRIPNLLGNTLRLRRLSPDAAREAITRPIDVYNQNRGEGLPAARVDADLVEAVVDEVRASRIQPAAGGTGTTSAADESDLIETALLQMVMTHLWRQASVVDGVRVLAKPAFEALGGARNVVKLHLYERLNDLDANGKAIAADLFQELVTPSGAKIAHTTSDLISFAKQPADRVIPVLEHLARARLLRRVDPPERYEIFHDALAPAILDWRAAFLEQLARKAAIQEAERRRVEAARVRNRRLTLALGVLIGVGSITVGLYYRREATQQQLIAELSEARAAKAEQLENAAKQAQTSAEQSRQEAELTLQKGQLEVDSMKARLSGQLDQEARLLAQAKSVDANIARVREASAKSSQQAATQLAAAAATQTKIDELSKTIGRVGPAQQAIQQPGSGAETTAPAPVPEKEPAKPSDAGAPVPAPSPSPPTGATTPPKGDYKAVYRQAINARDRKQWPQAAQLFETAAALKPDSGETITMPGFGDDQRYLPYYNLGVAKQNMKDCAGALDAWTRAEQAGAIQKSRSDYDALKKQRAACGAK
jgi:hypothetical protein